MFKIHLGDTPNALTQPDFEELGRRTDGFSGSDISVVVKDVLMEPVRKTQEATHFRRAPRARARKFREIWFCRCQVQVKEVSRFLKVRFSCDGGTLKD